MPTTVQRLLAHIFRSKEVGPRVVLLVFFADALSVMEPTSSPKLSLLVRTMLATIITTMLQCIHVHYGNPGSGNAKQVATVKTPKEQSGIYVNHRGHNKKDTDERTTTRTTTTFLAELVES